MKKLTLLICLIIAVGCETEKPVSGYYKVLNRNYSEKGDPFLSKLYGDTIIGGDTHLRRISGDTIVSYELSHFKLDSVVYVWSGKDYRKNISKNEIKTYGDVNRKYSKIDENTILIGIDTTGFSNEIKQEGEMTPSKIMKSVILEVYKEMGGGFTDTLSEISKVEFEREIQEYKRQDSVLYYQPYISDYKAESSIKWYIDFYLERNGELIDNSIEMHRQRDDLFHVKFKLMSPVIGGEDVYLYSFDFNSNDKFTATPL